MSQGLAVSLYVGSIKALPGSGRPTGMFKEPVNGPASIGPEGFVDDQQADRRVHGGPEKAIHLYPARHFAKLAARFPEAASQLVPGSMGENVSTWDLDESDVHLGDIWQLGSARIQVCQPRNPCWKIDDRFASDGMALFIAENHLTGWYWRVVQEGQVQPGDRLLPLQIAADALTLKEAMLLWSAHRPALSDLQKLAETPGIASQWKSKIDQRRAWLEKQMASD